MNRVTITLTIDLPDGVVPDVAYGSAVNAQVPYITESVPQEPAHVAEFAPIGSRPYDRDEVVTPQTIRDAPPPLCQHGIAMSRYPAGVNKQGKPYNASWRPSDPNCLTKPLWDAA